MQKIFHPSLKKIKKDISPIICFTSYYW